MNALVISDHFAVGGNATYLRNFVRTAKQTGLHVSLVTFVSAAGGPFDTKTAVRYKIPIRDYRFRQLLSRIFRLYRLLSDHIHDRKPDFILSDLCLPAAAFLLCRLCVPAIRSTPFFYQFHGSNALEKQSGMFHTRNQTNWFTSIKNAVHIYVLRSLETWVLRRATVIFVMSDYSELLLRHMNISGKIVKNPPGSESVYRNTYRTVTKKGAKILCGLTGDKKTVLIMSRLEPRKGVYHILDTLASDRSFLNQYQVVLCSQFDSFFGDEILARHSSLALGHAVLLINNPALKERALLYRASDVVLIPSLDLETFGFVALEAYATGTPVISYSTGALKEIVLPDYLVTRVGSGKDLLLKARCILSQSSSHNQRASSAFVQNSRKFSWKKHLRTVIKLAANP